MANGVRDSCQYPTHWETHGWYRSGSGIIAWGQLSNTNIQTGINHIDRLTMPETRRLYLVRCLVMNGLKLTHRQSSVGSMASIQLNGIIELMESFT